jgi:outer membrane protein assembly factor BamB
MKKRSNVRRVAAELMVAALVAVVAASSQQMPDHRLAAAHPSRECSRPPSLAGDWPQSGHDLSGSRTQPNERALSAARVMGLHPIWSFSTGEPSGLLSPGSPFANINSTPVESAGCVYFGTSAWDPGSPNVFALDADSGRVVWKRHLRADKPSIGGAVPGSLAVDGENVYVLVNQKGDGRSIGPYAVALDRHTGAVRWRGSPFDIAVNSYTNATPVVAGGVVIAGFSGWEGNPDAHGGFALLDARSGRTLARTYSIPRSAWIGRDGQHYGGAGIWTAPAVDSSGYAYMGTGNPYSKKNEDPRSNAILKVDVNRARRTFGQVVAFYKGDVEQSNGVLKTASRPTCELAPDDPLRQTPDDDPRLAVLQGALSDSHGCVQLDLDFGAGPNLFRDRAGRLIIGELQKSGTYHALYADTMRRAWTSVVGTSCQYCNGASPAYDRTTRSIYAAASPGSTMASISSDGGSMQWDEPVGDFVHYGGVSVANGVVYTVDSSAGFLDAFDVRGVPLLHRPLAADGASETEFTVSSSGVSIARNTVYAAAGNHVIAYRP